MLKIQDLTEEESKEVKHIALRELQEKQSGLIHLRKPPSRFYITFKVWKKYFKSKNCELLAKLSASQRAEVYEKYYLPFYN